MRADYRELAPILHDDDRGTSHLTACAGRSAYSNHRSHMGFYLPMAFFTCGVLIKGAGMCSHQGDGFGKIDGRSAANGYNPVEFLIPKLFSSLSNRCLSRIGWGCVKDLFFLVRR